MEQPTNPPPYIAQALALCRGTYQTGLITGAYCYSGADLQGRARKFSGVYRRSRDELLFRLSEARIPWHVEVDTTSGRLTLHIGVGQPVAPTLMAPWRGTWVRGDGSRNCAVEIWHAADVDPERGSDGWRRMDRRSEPISGEPYTVRQIADARQHLRCLGKPV